MVEAAAGRRSGTSRRRPSGSGGERQQEQQQRLVAVAVAARVVMVTTRSAGAAVGGAGGGGGAGSGGGGAGGRCMKDFFDCLLGVLGALGVSWAATRPQRQPHPAPPSGVAATASVDTRRFAAELRGIPGRIAGNGACAVASLYTMQGKKGVNQDAMIFWENFCSRDDTIFCGVFDGHGPYGHLVAKRVRDLLPVKLSADLGTDEGRETSTSNIKSNAGEVGSPEHIDRGDTTISSVAEQNGEYPESFPALRTSFLKTFYVMDRDLKLHKNIDCFFSGTTAVAVIKQGLNLIIGNLGDSRAVLGTRNENNQLVAVQLTVDLKPNIPSEAQRIRQRKGRIFALPEEPDVARVWLPKYNSPGLAMARAFGDFCLKDHGVISMPDVSYHHITEKDEFIVLATDGVWDVLSNEEVVSIVSRATSRTSAARFLVESAHRAWRSRFPTSKVDDCAVVCLFLNTDEPSESSSSMANNLANTVEVSSDECPATIQLSTGASADVVTALVTDRNELSVVDGVAKPVILADSEKDG
ncbi:probable protein phosphatase 2C 14 isoform X2 [Phragmites australis]|uniref:probable protein phosphatase 2C 14 isoform X2 n=1 Tax=Phragmites australis TaxID=29695 RepID=UPI002D791449|nr:probable protein phosphatase 2C 14 isoform X2 [Phragmites australis]